MNSSDQIEPKAEFSLLIYDFSLSISWNTCALEYIRVCLAINILLYYVRIIKERYLEVR